MAAGAFGIAEGKPSGSSRHDNGQRQVCLTANTEPVYKAWALPRADIARWEKRLQKPIPLPGLAPLPREHCPSQGSGAMVRALGYPHRSQEDGDSQSWVEVGSGSGVQPRALGRAGLTYPGPN